MFALEPNPYVFKVLELNASLNPASTRIVPLMFAAMPADGPPMRVIEDEDRWFAANLHRTSLMDANRRWRNREEPFLDASALARWVLQREVVKGPTEDLAAAE